MRIQVLAFSDQDISNIRLPKESVAQLKETPEEWKAVPDDKGALQVARFVSHSTFKPGKK